MKLISIFIAWIFTSFTFVVLPAQEPQTWTSGEIYQAIRKLNFLGSAMYIAAHPDDENTALISYLSNEINADVTYLSLTKGEGGQNQIGSETNDLLGVIRTQELLAARKIDNGKQIFSRAKDFGFTKNPEETLDSWGKNEILSDVVWALRRFQPDVIINRFYYEKDSSFLPTHGHHNASALLAYEAFELANDKNVYPEQLKHVPTWQPKRMFFNASWFFYGAWETLYKSKRTENDFRKESANRRNRYKDFANKHTNVVSFNVGTYYPTLGKSNNEISAKSRSLHKSQGFGTEGFRGPTIEHLILLKGQMPSVKDKLFDGINTTWTRLEGGAAIANILKKVEENFDFMTPSSSLDELLKAYQLIRNLPNGYWKSIKTEEIKTVIEACIGLFAEATASSTYASPGDQVQLSLEVTNRSNATVTLEKIVILPTSKDTFLNTRLRKNEPLFLKAGFQVPGEYPLTNSYWLGNTSTIGRNDVGNRQHIGLSETPNKPEVQFYVNINGHSIVFNKEIIYKKPDPVKGEIYQPFEIIPPVSIELSDKISIFTDGNPQQISVRVKSFKDNLKGRLFLRQSEGWQIKPKFVHFNLKSKGEEKSFNFNLFPPQSKSEGSVVPFVEIESNTYDKEIVSVNYNHIPIQTVLMDARGKTIKVDLKKNGNRIGYIQGSGDDIPKSLERIGYEVTILDNNFYIENLNSYDAIILGIRAYNTSDHLKINQDKLMKYVEQGGTMIVQYNSNSNLVIPMDQIGPYPLKISRDRVTNENAEVRFLVPDHPILNYPNKITAEDFEGWVQERGLYFPSEWDPKYTPVLSCNDAGESPKNGGLLVAKYGKGYYVYTGYSWFRELPAGVSGAYRIFANMISLGN